MRHVESKYREYPVALELPELESDRQLLRAGEIALWADGLGIRYNRDYVCFEYEDGPRGYRQKTLMAWAFKNKSHALQFKLTFGGWQ